MKMGCSACENNLMARVIVESSNPGPVGIDTGYVFKSPTTGDMIRVIAKVGESRDDAIRRVTARHRR
jgi:hypothetical protein